MTSQEFWNRTCRGLIFASLFFGLPAATSHAAEPTSGSDLPLNRGVGQRFSNFTLNDVTTDKPVSLYGYHGKKAVVLVFLGIDCPLSNLYVPRLVELQRKYADKGVVFVGVNSNEHDTVDQIRNHAKEYGISFPVVKDRKNLVADVGFVERTCEVLVLDGMAVLRYRGAIDDQYSQKAAKPAATRSYLTDSLDALLAKRPIAVPATTVVGCLLDRAPKEPVVAKPSRPRIRPAVADVAGSTKEQDQQEMEKVGKVTYAKDVQAIFQNKCQTCHRPGQVAPFSLLSYDDAKRRTAMIREVVDDRRMPPWHADSRYGHFSNDRRLTGSERATLLAWIDQGSPLGDVNDLRPEKSFPKGWSIGTPDMIFEIPEPYLVPAHGVVEYVHFKVPSNFKEDRWIQAAEAVPGDRSVIHHIIVYVDDHKDPNSVLDHHLCGYAPGDMPTVYEPGTAKKIPAGSDLIFQIHYTPNGKIRKDQSRLGIVFAKEPVTREAYTVAIMNDQFIIPPHQDDVPVPSNLTLGREIRLLSFLPHMHLRGKSFKYTVTKPGEKPQIVLSVPAYDFGWQTYYVLSEPMTLPKDTRIDCLAHYDNSDNNPSNPDPSKLVRWGDQTFNEMMIGYVDIDMPVDAKLSELRKPDPEEKTPIKDLLNKTGNSREKGRKGAGS